MQTPSRGEAWCGSERSVGQLVMVHEEDGTSSIEVTVQGVDTVMTSKHLGDSEIVAQVTTVVAGLGRVLFGDQVQLLVVVVGFVNSAHCAEVQRCPSLCAATESVTATILRIRPKGQR